jgi:D-arabinitol dehydrogenase (NADP+)
MRQLVVFGPESAAIVNVPVPVPGPDEVLIKVDACGIGPADLLIYRGEYPGRYPVVPGHEIAGTVAAAGAEVADLRPGDAVTVEPNLACGDCLPCKYGKRNFCKNWSALGVTRPGGLADYVTVPALNVFPIGRMPAEKAIFMEPLSCVLHGVKKLSITLGYQAFVAGAGPMGNLITQTLKSFGVTTVVGDPIPLRRELARQSGARKVFDTTRGFDVVLNEFPARFELVVDATGVPAVIEQLFRLAQPGGEVLLFGIPPRDTWIRLNPFELFMNGLTFHSSYTSVDNTDEAIDMLRSNRVDTTHLISHVLGLDAFNDALELLAEPAANETLKVVIKP